MTRMGDNLRSLRDARGLSQGQVAKMVGKTRSAISQYESGAIVPRMGTLEALARVYGVRKSEIVDPHYTFAAVELDGLSTREAELLDAFRRMDERDRRVVEGLVASLSAPIAGGNGGERVA